VSPVLLFIVLLVVSFGVLLWMLAPSKRETEIQRQLRDIGNLYTADASGTNILKLQALSAIPWVNGILVKFPGAIGLQLFMTQAGSRWSVGTLIIGSVVLACFAAWGMSLAVPIAWLPLGLGLAAGGIPYLYLYLKRQGRFKKFDAQLPEAIDLMARALRAGHAIISAVEIVSAETSEPLAAEFRAVFDEQNLGLAIREALLNLVSRVPTDGVRFLATAILLQKETGGNLAETLENLETVLRRRRQMKLKVRAMASEARASAAIIGSLPFITMAILSGINRPYIARLFETELGNKMLLGAAFAMTAGIYIMQKMAKFEI